MSRMSSTGPSAVRLCRAYQQRGVQGRFLDGRQARCRSGRKRVEVWHTPSEIHRRMNPEAAARELCDSVEKVGERLEFSARELSRALSRLFAFIWMPGNSRGLDGTSRPAASKSKYCSSVFGTFLVSIHLVCGSLQSKSRLQSWQLFKYREDNVSVSWRAQRLCL